MGIRTRKDIQSNFGLNSWSEMQSAIWSLQRENALLKKRVRDGENALNKMWFGHYDQGGYSLFEADGTLTFHNDATVWKDENFSGFSAGAVANAPDNIAWDGGTIETKGFDGVATLEQLYANKELQHDYLEGSDLVFHIHWAPTTAGAGNVKWNIDYTIERDVTGTIAAGSLSVVDAASGTAWQPERVNIGTVNGANVLIADQIGIRLYRDPTDVQDTYGADAALAFTFGYHYELDTVGSRQITTK